MLDILQFQEALSLVGLPPVMSLTSGKPDIVIGLVDGPVDLTHQGFNTSNVRVLGSSGPSVPCTQTTSLGCMHGTFVAGLLSARKDYIAPGIVPGCTLLVRPVFTESASVPSATARELASAIIETMDAGARVLNLSVAVESLSPQGEREINQALDAAARRRVPVVAAAGNEGTVGSSAIIRHPWVLPVVACDRQGTPSPESNLSNPAGRRGLQAPGVGITGLAPNGGTRTFGGTSAAAPFVTGAMALMWSALPSVTAAEMKFAIAHLAKRKTIVPPLLDAWTTYQALAGTHMKGRGP